MAKQFEKGSLMDCPLIINSLNSRIYAFIAFLKDIDRWVFWITALKSRCLYNHNICQRLLTHRPLRMLNGGRAEKSERNIFDSCNGLFVAKRFFFKKEFRIGWGTSMCVLQFMATTRFCVVFLLKCLVLDFSSQRWKKHTSPMGLMTFQSFLYESSRHVIVEGYSPMWAEIVKT